MGFGEILIYIVCYFGLLTSIYFLITLYENRKKFDTPKYKLFPFVSVIVPAYNEEKTLAKTINSLKSLNYPKNKLQIIVIDDGSTDSTYNIAKSFKGIEVYRKKNGGKSTALNLGLKKARGELVGALDADSFADKESLRRLVGYFNDKNIMAVTPSLHVYKPKSFLQKIQKIEYLISIFLRKIFSFLGSIHVTPGPFTIYRKEFFDIYGGYDENNMTEDIEIALRIQSKGYEIENSHNANVFTVSPYHFKPLLNQRLRWYLGFIENVYNYKFLFSPKFGNLGLIILPTAFISAFLVILMMFYTLFTITKDIIKTILNYYNIRFDFLKIIDFKIDFFYLNMENYALLTMITLFIRIIILIVGKNIAREKQKIHYLYILYMLFYWFLFGFWWFGGLFLKMFNKRIYWGQKKL